MPPRPSTIDRHDALRDRLLDRAELQIAEHGLQGLRARTLADAAGCSVGAIYSLFPDLDGLVLAVNARTLEAIDRALHAAARGSASEQLVRIAEAYLSYAAYNRARWEALMQHRLPPGQTLPGWYLERRDIAFSHIETPLAALRPGQPGTPALARTLFAAVHGIVVMGLDAKLDEQDLPTLQSQLHLLVQAITIGLTR